MIGVLAGGIVLAAAGAIILTLPHPSPSLTTDTLSSTLSDDAAKVAFLGRYLKLASPVEAAEFHVIYHDNSGGMVPGPSEWDIQAVMKVAPADLPAWTSGMTPTEAADLSWGRSLLGPEPRWAVHSALRVYQRGRTIVAVFEPEGIVFKRAQAD